MTTTHKQPSDTDRIEDLARIIELQQEIAASELDAAKLMELVCHRTQALTSASGAVVETVDGKDLVYGACSGVLQASAGLRVPLFGSLSGRSLLTKEVLVSNDTENDPRVNREACVKAGVRSMICVPLATGTRAQSVLKVVSGRPHAFSPRDVKLLRLTGGLLSASVQRASEAGVKAEALASLKASEAKFRTLAGAAHEGVILSKDGITVDVNGSFLSKFDYRYGEIIGRPVVDFFCPDERAAAEAFIAGPHDGEFQGRALKKDGTPLSIEATGKTVESAGELIRVFSVRDVTIHKEAEKALRESETRSREALRVKTEFLANMSHEIRTPLNGVMGMLGLMLDGELSPQQREYGVLAKKSAETLLGLLNDVLDFSKSEASQMSVERIAFDLPQLVEEIRQVLTPAMRAKSLQFVVSVSPQVPRHVVGDPMRLRQIITNLANNAIKFTAEGTVMLRVHRAGLMVRFDVIDTGIGIPEAALSRLFTPFNQVDASTTRRYGGTGLGLSICRQLVELMGGEIGVYSHENHGSTFWFTLPLTETTGAAPTPVLPDPVPAPSARPLKILVADDNAVNQLVAAAMVRKMGHEPVVANDGAEVLEALSNGPFDLVLMDCQMPHMDGYTATRRIRASGEGWNGIPVIAMTASALEGDREKCLEAGMNGHVTKPTVFAELQEAIERGVTPSGKK